MVARQGRGLGWLALLWLAAAPCCARVVLVRSAYTAVRVGPGGEYARLALFQPGVPLWAEDSYLEWYRVRLHGSLVGWVNFGDVTPQAQSMPRPHGDVTDLSVEPFERGVRVRISLSSTIPFRVIQKLRPAELKIDLFGATLARRSVRCLPVEPFVLAVSPEQLRGELVELSVDLKIRQQTGFDVYYANPRELNVDIRRPVSDGRLRGKTIALDPGHGGRDSGAQGPTGLLEKDVNLKIALALRGLLRRAGARVFMTREGDAGLTGLRAGEHEELLARVMASKRVAPDLFLSIHNNDAGRGNRNSVFGTETYCWSPMSLAPARLLHRGLCAALGTRDRGVWRRPYLVLEDTDAPRVLVECAYITCRAEEARLRDDKCLNAAAQGLFNGMVAYFRASAEPPPPY